MRKLFSLFAALTLCAGLWAALNPGYNEPEGSFYSCYYYPSNGAANVQVPQLFMPYMDEYTFTSRHGAGDWKMGDQTATGAETFSPKYAFGTYTEEGMPELTASDTTYVYGSGSTSGSARRVYAGDGAYHYITNAKHYVVKQSTMVTKMSGYLKIRTYFFNRPDQVMLVSKILIPITTNRNGETVADLFPAEDSHMKVAVYQATCSRTSLDKYSKAIDYSKRLVDTLTLTVKNYMQSNNAYAGILIAELPEPVSIKGAFCVEITDYETMGPETRLIGDNTTGTTSQYLKYKNAGDSQLTVYTASSNFEVAVYGAMPSIAKASEAEAIEIPAIGGAAEAFDIYSSTKITAKEITLPEWANLDTIMYEGDTYAANKKISIVLSASANATGADRTGEMVINNLGMKLTCAISQPAPVAPQVDTVYIKNLNDVSFAPDIAGNFIISGDNVLYSSIGDTVYLCSLSFHGEPRSGEFHHADREPVNTYVKSTTLTEAGLSGLAVVADSLVYAKISYTGTEITAEAAMQSNYSVPSLKNTIYYFTLSKTTTDLKDIIPSAKIRKMLINGQVVIYRDDAWFDLNGRKL